MLSSNDGSYSEESGGGGTDYDMTVNFSTPSLAGGYCMQLVDPACVQTGNDEGQGDGCLIWVEVAGACYPITVDPAVIAAPVINSISFGTSPVVAGVSNVLTITGSNFGASGFVEVCPADGSTGCTQPGSGSPVTWGTGTIQIGWNNPSWVAGVTYCVVVLANRFDGGGILQSICSAAALFYVPQKASGPVVSFILPALGPVGGSVQVYINGSGFGTTPSVTVKDANGNGIPVTIGQSQNSGPTLIAATFAIPENAAGGNATVTVTAGGQASNSVNFYVQIPKSLVRQTAYCPPSGTCTAPAGAANGYGLLYTPGTPPPNGNIVNSFGTEVLATNVCGVYRNLAYSIVDQETPAQVIQGLSKVILTETFSDYTGPGQAPPTLLQTVNLASCPGGSSGCYADVGDTISLQSATTCIPSNYNQNYTQGFSVTIGQTVYNLTTQNRVSIGNVNGTLQDDVTISKP
jgi:hypothetical protein